MHFFLLQQYRATVHVCIVTAHTALQSYREQSEVDLLYLFISLKVLMIEVMVK